MIWAHPQPIRFQKKRIGCGRALSEYACAPVPKIPIEIGIFATAEKVSASCRSLVQKKEIMVSKYFLQRSRFKDIA